MSGQKAVEAEKATWRQTVDHGLINGDLQTHGAWSMKTSRNARSIVMTTREHDGRQLQDILALFNV